MAKDKITEYDATANNNTVVGDVNLAENSALPSDMNNAIREIMSHQKEAFGSGTPLFVDQTNNKVGIGETSPQTKLHIKTADASATADSNSAVVIEGTDATRADLQFLGDAGAFQAIYFGDNSDADIGRIAYDHTGNSMRINVNASERVRINDDGNVLIGRTSELNDFGDGRTSLVLQGTGSQDYSTIQLGNNGTASNTQILGLVGFYDGTNENARVQAQRATSTDSANLLFFTREASGSNTERARIQDDGKFTVGSSTAESGSLASVHSNGSALYQLALVSTTTSGTQYHQQFIRGSTQAGYITSSASQTVTLHNTSDERLKENIQDSDSATQSIKDIKVRKFNWKDNSDITIEYGFIAQELIKCVPEAVHEGTDEKDENGNYKLNWGVGYANLVPRLVKTIQELEARITKLEGA